MTGSLLVFVNTLLELLGGSVGGRGKCVMAVVFITAGYHELRKLSLYYICEIV